MLNMQSEEEFLAFMDFLDLDEEIVDSYLKIIMSIKSPSKRHLISAIQLLNYKQLINLKEGLECENNKEFEFVAHLIVSANSDIIEYVCRIISIVLNLNSSTMLNKSEHLLQQMLSSIGSTSEDSKSNAVFEHESNISSDLKSLMNFRICDTVLDVVIKNGETITLPFLEIPLERIFFNEDNQVLMHFLNKTVPRLFEAVISYDILDNIWTYTKSFKKDNFSIALNMLGCLSEFYLPDVDNLNNKLESKMIYDHNFWRIILLGLKDASLRKTSVYLAKRAVDYIINIQKDIEVKDDHNSYMTWKCKKEKELKIMWDNYFILMDSLEERQSNIVLPALKLFENLKEVEKCWLDCIFEIGLKHENYQVRLKCIDYKLESIINHELETQTLLEALNDTNIFTQTCDYEKVKEKIAIKCKDLSFFICFIKTFSLVKWSPVPLYHLSTILATLCVKDFFKAIDSSNFREIIGNILKIPCNINPLKNAIVKNILEFVENFCKSLQWQQIVEIFYF